MEDSGESRRRSYDALTDRYLRDYFTLPQVKTQLLKVGLMTRDGRILNEDEYKRAAIRRQQRWSARQQLARKMAMDAREKHLARQLELQKQLETVSRVELYRKMKGESRQHHLISIAPLELERTLSRSQSAPSYRRPLNASRTDNGASMPPLVSPDKLFNSSGYHTDDDRPRSELPSEEEHAQRKLDNASLERYDAYLRLQLNRLEKARMRPFTYAYSDDDEITHILTAVEPEAGLPQIPDRPIDSLYDYRGRVSPGRPRWRHLQLRTPRLQGSEKSSENGTGRSRSESPTKRWHSKALVSRLYITSAAAPGRRRRQPQASCDCHLQYIGPRRTVGQPVESSLHKITITQQHCGGNSINVFSGELMPRAKFEFVSYRQRGYPFSLTITEDNSNVLRISTCCESRYAVGTKLGGEKGTFRWLGVANAVPCYKCQMYRGFETPHSNYAAKPVKRKKTTPSVPKLITKPQLRKPRPATPPKGKVTKKSGFTIVNKQRPSAAVTTAAAGVTAVGVAALAMGPNEGAEDGKEDDAVDDEKTLREDLDQQSPSETDSASESGTESASESDSEEDNEEEEETEGQVSRKSSTQGESGNDHSDAVPLSNSDRPDNENDRTSREEGISVHKGLAMSDDSHSKSPHMASNDQHEESEHREDEGTATESDNGNSEDESSAESESHSSNQADSSKTRKDPGDTEIEMDGEAVTANVGEKDEENTERGNKTTTGSESESETSQDESETNSQSTVKLTQSGRDGEDSDKRSDLIKNIDEENEIEVPGAMEEKVDAGPAGDSVQTGIVQEASEKPEPTYHDAGVQPNAIDDDEQSESGSEDSGSGGSESGSEESDKEKQSENDAKPQVGSTEAHELTQRLKSASAAMLSAESDLVQKISQPEDSNGQFHTENYTGPEDTGKVQGETEASKLLPKANGGIWYCGVCNFDNDPDMVKCRICDVPRGQLSEASEVTPVVVDQLRAEQGVAGPWMCRVCNFDNESDLSKCRVCGVPRSSSESPTAQANEKDEQKSKDIKVEEGDQARLDIDDGADDGDTLADAESIRNDHSEAGPIVNVHKESNEEKMDLLGPPITVIPPSKSPSVMSYVEERGGKENGSEGGIGKRSEQNELSEAYNSQATGTKETTGYEETGAEEETESNTMKSSQVTDTVFNQNASPLDTSCAVSLRSAASTIMENGQEQQSEDSNGTKRDAVSAKLREACRKEHVAISNVDLTSAAVAVVTQELKENQNLMSLTIRNCNLTDDRLAAIDGVLLEQDTPLIKLLNFNMNNLSPASLPRLIDMTRRYRVDTLLVRGNQLGDNTIASLFEELATLDCVRKLDVGQNQISKSSAQSLGNFLTSTRTLQALSLGGSSNFDLDDWKDISQGFLRNETLETIGLGYCNMGDEAAEVVCMALKNNTKLNSVDLDGNNLADRGAAAVLDLVDSLPNLVNVVWTAGNRVSPSAVQMVRQILSARS